MMFRNEIFVSRALVNPIVRGCPVCLREDATKDPENPLWYIVMRGDWQFQEVNICIQHRHPLVPLWSQQAWRKRYDYSSRLKEILPEILNGELDQPLRDPTEYDRWLDQRVETGLDETWLSTQSLFAATVFCRLLGNELLHSTPLAKGQRKGQVQSAHAVGFADAAKGEVAILNSLNVLVESASGAGDGPKKAFGGLIETLGRTHLEEPAFDSFRDILRERILANWPVAAGENLLGKVQGDRRLHSVHSASAESGIGIALLKQFLVHAGAIATDDARPLARQTFDAVKYADLLDEIPNLVSWVEMRRSMGATRSQLQSLVNDRVLVPRIDTPSIKAPWRLSDGTALVSELDALAVPTLKTDSQWEPIQRAKTRSSLSVGMIIAAIREHKLQVGRHGKTVRYSDFRVLKTEINLMDKSLRNQQGDLFVSAAAFGRSVGIRRTGWFENLADAGHSPATRRLYSNSRQRRIYLSEQDVKAFHERFLTLTTMERMTGENRQTILAKLRTAGVEPFQPNNEDYGPLYLRSAVEAALR